MENHIRTLIGEIRNISGMLHARQVYNEKIKTLDPELAESIYNDIESKINKSILSTSLKLRRLITNDTNSYFGKEDTKTIISLFNHAAHIPFSESEKLYNTCTGIITIVTSLSMRPKTNGKDNNKKKKVAHVKGNPEVKIETECKNETTEVSKQEE